MGISPEYISQYKEIFLKIIEWHKKSLKIPDEKATTITDIKELKEYKILETLENFITKGKAIDRKLHVDHLVGYLKEYYEARRKEIKDQDISIGENNKKTFIEIEDEILDIFDDIKCTRCGEENKFTNEKCFNCGNPIIW